MGDRTGFAPRMVFHRRVVQGEIRQLRRFLAIIKELVQRHFKCPSHLLQRFYGRNRMAILYARYVATKQTCGLLDVVLR